MSFELISGDPVAMATAADLRHFSSAARSVMELAQLREDVVLERGLLDVQLDDAESQRLACSPDEVSVNGKGGEVVPLPREIWLVEEQTYGDPAKVADAIECDMQFYDELQGQIRMTDKLESHPAIKVLKDIISMQCRLARGSENQPIVRTKAHRIAWEPGAPYQSGNLAYGPKGGAELYLSTPIKVGGLAIGEANGWLRTFNDYIGRS